MSVIRKIAVAQLGVPKSNPLGRMPHGRPQPFRDWTGVRNMPLYHPYGRDRQYKIRPIPNMGHWRSKWNV